LKCRKCGAELHPEQRVCIECGERTAAGGKFYVEEEQHWWPSRKMIQIAVGAVGAVLLILILYSVLHVVPPDAVARNWFDAMVQRRVVDARAYVTPKFEQDLSTRMMDLAVLADEYLTEVVNNKATYDVGKPVYDRPDNPASAQVTIRIRYVGGGPGRDVVVQMAKVGRAWRINGVT